MNLQQTIDELEHQAARYTQAAQSLRALLDEGVALPTEDVAPVVAAKRGRKPKSDAAANGNSSANATPAAKGRKTGKKRVVSAETKAKLAASMKARHQQRREQQLAAQAPSE